MTDGGRKIPPRFVRFPPENLYFFPTSAAPFSLSSFSSSLHSCICFLSPPFKNALSCKSCTSWRQSRCCCCCCCCCCWATSASFLLATSMSLSTLRLKAQSSSKQSRPVAEEEEDRDAGLALSALASGTELEDLDFDRSASFKACFPLALCS